MPDGLVGLQEHNPGEQDDRHLAVGGVISDQQLIQLTDNTLSIGKKVGFVDTLPTAGGASASGHVLTALHAAVLIDTHGVDRGKDFYDVFLNLRALRIHENNLFADEFKHPEALNDAGLVEGGIHFLQESHFFIQTDGEGIDLIRAGETAHNGFLFRQADREGYTFGGNAGVVEGFLKNCIRIG